MEISGVMELCLICRDSCATISTRPIDKVNQFIQQFGGQGQGLKFTEPSEVILCDDCLSGVVKATEWREELDGVERQVRSLLRQLHSLQGNYLEEMRRLETKIRSSECGSRRATGKADKFRKVIPSVIRDLVINDLCTHVVHTKSVSAAEPQVSEFQELKIRSNSPEVSLSQLLKSVEIEPAAPRIIADPNPDIVTAPPPHPLLNNVVLKHLFTYLAESDLRSCRLVHPTWKLEALPHLKKRGKSFLQIRTYTKFNYSYKFWELSNYIENSAPDDIPFSVEKVCFSSDLQGYGPDWRELLKVLATRVTEVIVIVRHHASPLIPMGLTFPKLTTLRVRKVNVLSREWSYLTTLVASSPNLKTLELEQADFWTLRSLSRIKGVKLHTFQLRSLSHREGSRAGLHLFLMCQTDTLKDLVVGATIDIFRIFPQFEVRMPNTRITVTNE